MHCGPRAVTTAYSGAVLRLSFPDKISGTSILCCQRRSQDFFRLEHNPWPSAMWVTYNAHGVLYHHWGAKHQKMFTAYEVTRMSQKKLHTFYRHVLEAWPTGLRTDAQWKLTPASTVTTRMIVLKQAKQIKEIWANNSQLQGLQNYFGARA